jgi:DNA-binding MarR family transcriptional regulator
MPPKTPTDLLPELLKLARRFPSLRLKQGMVDGLTRSEYELLMLLRMQQDGSATGISVSNISEMLHISPAGVTHLINPLEEKAFVQRLADASDRRVVRIGLTRKGIQTADALIGDVRGQLDGLVAHLGQDDTRTLVRLLSRALEYFASQSEE